MTVRAVTLLIYNRPTHTQRALERIALARPTHLLVAADGPANPADAEACRAARAVATNVTWPCTVLTSFADQNFGVRHGVARGVSWALEQVSESIIVEDDCVATPEFFTFCWAMLDRYRDDARIMHVGGESYHEAASGYPYSYYFSKYPLPWGWATWQRAWQLFDFSMAGWPELLEGPRLESLFDNPEEREYWSVAIQQAMAGLPRITWDYYWQFACWLHGGLAIHPRVNLVSNIGWGDDSSTTRGASVLAERPTATLGTLVHPPAVVRDLAADHATFDLRYPGKYIRRRRTLAYRLTLPARHLKRWLFP